MMTIVTPAQTRGIAILEELSSFARQHLAKEMDAKENGHALVIERISEVVQVEVIKKLEMDSLLSTTCEFINAIVIDPTLRDSPDFTPDYPGNEWNENTARALSSIRYTQYCLARVGLDHQYDELIEAAGKDDVEGVKALVEKGLNPDFATIQWEDDPTSPLPSRPQNLTALGYACFRGAKKTVEYLMTQNADPNFAIMPNSDGKHPFQADMPFIESWNVVPALVGLLSSSISHDDKADIWNLIKDKADPLIREGNKWWLSRCFASSNMKRDDLRMVLSAVDNVRAKTNPINGSMSNFLKSTFYDIGNELNFGGWDNPPNIMTPWNNNAVELGSVMAFYGAEIPTLFRKSLELRGTSEFNILHKVISWEIDINGQPLHMVWAGERYNTEEARLKSQVGEILSEDPKEAKARQDGIMKTLDDISTFPVRSLHHLIVNYVAPTPTDFRTWVTKSCLDITFNSKKK